IIDEDSGRSGLEPRDDLGREPVRRAEILLDGRHRLVRWSTRGAEVTERVLHGAELLADRAEAVRARGPAQAVGERLGAGVALGVARGLGPGAERLPHEAEAIRQGSRVAQAEGGQLFGWAHGECAHAVPLKIWTMRSGSAVGSNGLGISPAAPCVRSSAASVTAAVIRTTGTPAVALFCLSRLKRARPPPSGIITSRRITSG